jgi:hypothetical protein
MEIRSKDYFERELENILFIHFDAKCYFKDVKYLNYPETTEEKVAAAENFIIRRIRIAFWRLGIIEIAKLFLKSKNQHYNLIQYIEELISNYDEYSWIQNLPKNKLIDWLELLNSNKIKSIRHRISIQRNKYFAHTDKNPQIKLDSVKINFDEIDTLINLTESIIFELKVHCLSTHADFEITGLERAGNILTRLAALKEKREAEVKRKLNEYLQERNKRNST